jgi:aspartate kinase
MGLIVQKFGGTSLADRICLYNVANIIARRIREGNQVVTVVSAQGDETDRLVAKAHEITQTPAPREFDALITAGEQISAALLSITLVAIGIPAVSMNGAQIQIKTNDVYGDAEIQSIQTHKIREYLERGTAVIVTGFQGVDGGGNVTSLGRGGSDTTAVALAAALKADECRIYKDVDGIYSADPRKDLSAKKYDHISYDEMLKIADAGSGVLQRRSIELAKKNQIPLQILSSFQPLSGTLISN